MSSFASLTFAGLVSALAVQASLIPTTVQSPAKRFAPSAANTCYYTCPIIDSAPGSDGGDTTVTIYDTSSYNLPAAWSAAAGGALINENICTDEADFATKRALPRLVTRLQNTAMTTKDCIEACDSEGYSIAGTQYSDQCWCGNALNVVTLTSFASTPSTPCRGDSSQSCGGSCANNIYYNTDKLNADLTPKTATQPVSRRSTSLTRRAPASSTVTYTTCSYPNGLNCLYTASGGVAAPGQTASCPATADSNGPCDSTSVTIVDKRRFARSLTPLEIKLKSRQWSPAKGRALQARRVAAAEGRVWR